MMWLPAIGVNAAFNSASWSMEARGSPATAESYPTPAGPPEGSVVRAADHAGGIGRPPNPAWEACEFVGTSAASGNLISALAGNLPPNGWSGSVMERILGDLKWSIPAYSFQSPG